MHKSALEVLLQVPQQEHVGAPAQHLLKVDTKHRTLLQEFLLQSYQLPQLVVVAPGYCTCQPCHFLPQELNPQPPWIEFLPQVCSLKCQSHHLFDVIKTKIGSSVKTGKGNYAKDREGKIYKKKEKS